MLNKKCIENGYIIYSLGKDGEDDGLSTEWYENGKKREEINCKDGEYDGLWTQWFESGVKRVEGHYKDGKVEGLVTEWYRSGEKTSL